MKSHSARAMFLWFALILSATAAENDASLSISSALVSESDAAMTDTIVTAAAAAASDIQSETPEQPALAHDLSPWGMYQGADTVVKSVMISLLLASLLTWTVCLYKSVQLRQASRQSQRLLQHLQQCASFTQALKGVLQHPGASTSLVKSCQHELTLSGTFKASDSSLKERLAASLERVQAGLSAKMNRGTGALATIGSVAPFVGLFGTVWGIMNSFIGIAETQTTNLAVVAPGIAEALLATAFGLVAAIPAVVIYNHFARGISQYRARLTDIATALMLIISRDLDRQSLAEEEKESHGGNEADTDALQEAS